MNIERSEAQHHGSNEPVRVEAGTFHRPDSVTLLLVTVLALTGGAALVALRYPWALANAAACINGSPAVAAAFQARYSREQPAKEIREKPEPFIADDIRIEGFRYASAGVAGSMPRSVPARDELTC